MNTIFGTELSGPTTFIVAFVIVLGLIGLTALMMRRFGSGRIATAGGGRGRQPRLAVLDSAIVDQKRRLVLIRRDNAEHLLLIGGPSDVVVETNIVRTGAPAPLAQPLTQTAPSRAAQPAPRGAHAPVIESEAPIVPEAPHEEAPRAPAPAAPAPRTQPAAFTPPPPLPPQPRPVAHPSANIPLPSTPAQMPAAPAPAPQAAAPAAPEPEAKSEPKLETKPEPEAEQPAPQVQVKLDPQYADMAQRLEAALRRPAAVPPAAPAPQPPRSDTRPMMPQVNAPRPAPEPTRAMPAAPQPASKGPAMPGPSPQSAPNPFDSLEAEMASLLGQKKN